MAATGKRRTTSYRTTSGTSKGGAGDGKAVTKTDGLRTIAHLASDAGMHMGHATRHIQTLQPGNPKAAKFNRDHALGHAREAATALKQLAAHIDKNPQLAKESKLLNKANPVVASKTKKGK